MYVWVVLSGRQYDPLIHEHPHGVSCRRGLHGGFNLSEDASISVSFGSGFGCQLH